jgi:hypothetical protein
VGHLVLKIIDSSFFGKDTFTVVLVMVFCAFGCEELGVVRGGLMSGSFIMLEGGNPLLFLPTMVDWGRNQEKERK